MALRNCCVAVNETPNLIMLTLVYLVAALSCWLLCPLIISLGVFGGVFLIQEYFPSNFIFCTLGVY